MAFNLSDYNNINIQVPRLGGGALIGSQFVSSHIFHGLYDVVDLISMLQDWNFTTTPVEGLNDRVLEYPRGFVLGGSTSISERHAHLYTKAILTHI